MHCGSQFALISCGCSSEIPSKVSRVQNGRIGILLDFVWYEPLTRGREDIYSAQRARDFHVGWFIHPITYGEYPRTMREIVGDRLPKFTKEERLMVQGSIDFVGINQYTTYYISNPPPQEKPKALSYQQDWHAEFTYEKNGVPIGPKEHSDWLYNVPWGLYKAITYIKERYGNPTVILSENGMDYAGNQTFFDAIDDTKRIAYYRGYLAELRRAIKDGANHMGAMGGVILLLLASAFCALTASAAAANVIVSSDSDASETLSRKSFPEGFVFGTATSAYQVEGMALKDGRGPCIWEPFVKIPGYIANNATADVTADEYHHYKEDVDIMSKLNFDVYRFSISWSRIFPDGTGRVNWKGVTYYNRLINYMLKRGITPYANLYHSDLPLALEKKYNGLLSREVVKDYADYADYCFKKFGDRVKNWMTFNEPRCIAAIGYDGGGCPPGRCSKEVGNCTAGNSGTEPYIVAHNLILSHAAAAQRYRNKYQETQKGRIGIVLDFGWYEPLTSGEADNNASLRACDFHVGWFIHPLVYGNYPSIMQEIVGDRLPRFTEEERLVIKGSMDFVGINHYTSSYVYNQPPQTKQQALSYQQDWHVVTSIMKDGVPIGPRVILGLPY
ncbi:hypothetical protein Ancab_025796 [Ancistrocladus abbreviatus]